MGYDINQLWCLGNWYIFDLKGDLYVQVGILMFDFDVNSVVGFFVKFFGNLYDI